MLTRFETAPVVDAPSSHLSPEQLNSLRQLLIEEHVIQTARAIELQDAPGLEPDLAEVLLVRCRESLEEIEAALRLIDQTSMGCVRAAAQPSHTNA